MFVLSMVLHHGTLRGGFVWDDRLAVVSADGAADLRLVACHTKLFRKVSTTVDRPQNTETERTSSCDSWNT